ncbi:MAG: polysaccharide deacetylase family protein [Myxococcota bacterium]
MFHRVLPAEPAAFGLPNCYRMRGTALTVAELERVLDEAGPIVPLAAVEGALVAREEPPTGSVLTFDDGYREHLDVVAPMLAARGATATFYVATGLRGNGSAVGVVDAWYWLLDHAERGSATVGMPDGGTFRGRIDTAEEKAAWVGGPPKVALLAATPAEQRRMLHALAESTGTTMPPDLARRLYLASEDWLALVQIGMRVGAHSVGHPRLTQLSDEELDREVGESIATIAATSAPVAFAYPDGAFNERVVGRVRAAGASSAVTCEIGVAGGGVEVLRLPRLFVAPSSGSLIVGASA